MEFVLINQRQISGVSLTQKRCPLLTQLQPTVRLFPDNEGERSGGRLGLTVMKSGGEESEEVLVVFKCVYLIGKIKPISLPLPDLNAKEQNGEILYDGAFCENTVCADQFSCFLVRNY